MQGKGYSTEIFFVKNPKNLKIREKSPVFSRFYHEMQGFCKGGYAIMPTIKAMALHKPTKVSFLKQKAFDEQVELANEE